MVVLNKIYTRTGDDGTTALGNDQRRKKYDLRVSAYGTIDECNSAIGIARLHTATDPQLDAMLARIQNDLFDLGADLASPDKAKGPAGERMSIVERQVERLEKLNAERRTMRAVMIYRMNLILTPDQRVKLEAFLKRRDQNRRRQPDRTERRH